MKHRLERVNDLIKRELGELVGRECQFPAALVTVQEVDITPDLKHAHVFVSVIGSDEDRHSSMAILHAARVQLQAALSKRVVLKFTPQLHFKLDAAGGYLGLVHPDGTTVASEFRFGPQRRNVSFGTAQVLSPTPLLSEGSLARVYVPTDDRLGTAWRGTDDFFDDSAWSRVPTGGQAGLRVHHISRLAGPPSGSGPETAKASSG